MVDLAFFQSISYIAGAIGVCIAAISYATNLRISQRNQELNLKAQQQYLETRQTQLFMQVLDKMDPNFQSDLWEILNEWKWSDFDDFMKRYGPGVNPKFVKVFNLMEHVGVLAREGLLDTRLLWFWIGNYPLNLWTKYQSIIHGLRERYDKPRGSRSLEFFEELVLILEQEKEKDLNDSSRRHEKREAIWASLKPV